jgi:hypothetical protein
VGRGEFNRRLRRLRRRAWWARLRHREFRLLVLEEQRRALSNAICDWYPRYFAEREASVLATPSERVLMARLGATAVGAGGVR